ncbi:xanthine dehydrogenase family protein molybdopterin-binding subunit [Sneathiella chinensis]|uniref:Aldehyde oxidase n=1 Tax=Sneathiella chinensis TaxID=349750 RepID=A0ABQ5U448_9PROT|nr:xanthine dehydrogenase family protein molybdopterin-binding subunit [Sneathiella chinensis]GLQ06689.1 aldehyde oxidase [Sneathiella chinensis]
MAKFKFSRRKFLIAGGLVGGGLAIGFGFKEDTPDAAAFAETMEDGEYVLNAWVKIAKSGKITVAVPHSEMGQGIYTALSMLVAEELEVDVAAVTPEQAPIAPVYANFTAIMDSLPFSDGHHKGEATIGAWGMRKVANLLGVQVTGGSTSVRNSWESMQKAGAMAREMLIAAAAQLWQVSPGECRAEQGHIVHPASGKRASYADLVESAADMEPPTDVTLKAASLRKVIGTSPKRQDIPDKVTGKAGFGLDATLYNRDLLYAAVKLCPVFGGTVRSWDEDAIRTMPGVRKVVSVGTGVAVVADSFWRAKKAVDALPVTFDEGDNANLSSEGIFQQYRESLQQEEGRSYVDDGDTNAALAKAGSVLSATYQVPFLAHACMEPMNCTAFVGENEVEVSIPNQAPTLMAWFAEKTADVDAENVTVHTPYLGGGFGRRAEIDLVVMAVTIAKETNGAPVKLIWTRENDIQHDMYRPAALAEFKAVLGADGKAETWLNRVASPSVTRSFTERMLPWAGADMPDNTTAEGAADIPYQFPNKLMEHVPVRTPVPVGYWRSVGHSYNAFFTECFMDEMAHAAGTDPVDFRLAHLEGQSDFTAVLKKLAAASGWGQPLPAGRARGIALHESFGSIVGQVAEISVDADKTLTVHKVTCVVDCGTVVNPDTVRAQMESGIVFGLSAAFYGEITIENGRVQQSNFPDYDMVRLANCPEIEVHIAASGRPLGGIGEPGTPPIAPAVANALFAATGERVRSLPLTKHGFSV